MKNGNLQILPWIGFTVTVLTNILAAGLDVFVRRIIAAGRKKKKILIRQLALWDENFGTTCLGTNPNTWGVQVLRYPNFFSGMEADRNVKVVGGDVAVL